MKRADPAPPTAKHHTPLLFLECEAKDCQEGLQEIQEEAIPSDPASHRPPVKGSSKESLYLHIISFCTHCLVWFAQKQPLRQAFQCEYFVWEVIPGHISWRIRKKGRDGRESGKGALSSRLALGHMALNFSGDLWRKA